MPRNVEIKAHIDDVETLAATAAALADQGPFEIAQDDTFFRCDSGRLKLRVIANGGGELIYYQRASAPGPKESFYLISPTSAPDALRELLAAAYGEVGRVRKRRILFLVGRTRVHIDNVERWGIFLNSRLCWTTQSRRTRALVRRVNSWRNWMSDPINRSKRLTLICSHGDAPDIRLDRPRAATSVNAGVSR